MPLVADGRTAWDRRLSRCRGELCPLRLGLWLSRQIVEAHGGRLYVSSAPEEGSIFTVELPRHGALAPADDASET